MSIQTPAEHTFRASLIDLFNLARDQLPLGNAFYKQLEERLRQGMLDYMEETTFLTDPGQLELLREGAGVYLDEYLPDLVSELRSSTESFFSKGQEDRAFSVNRAETIVLNETRRIRAYTQFAADLIERRW